MSIKIDEKMTNLYKISSYFFWDSDIELLHRITGNYFHCFEPIKVENPMKIGQDIQNLNNRVSKTQTHYLRTIVIKVQRPGHTF